MDARTPADWMAIGAVLATIALAAAAMFKKWLDEVLGSEEHALPEQVKPVQPVGRAGAADRGDDADDDLL